VILQRSRKERRFIELSGAFKKISATITVLLILLTAFVTGAYSHQNHGGVEVGGYLVDVQPKVFTAGRPTDFFVLIDYKSNETGVSGLSVVAQIKAVGGEGFRDVTCREVAAGQYICTHSFEREGKYIVVVRFDSLGTTFSVTVKAAGDSAVTAPLNYLLIALGAGVVAILSVKVFNSHRVKKRQEGV
jgi:hypothetical protein